MSESGVRRLERAKEITQQEANAAFEDLMDLDVELHAFESFSERVWDLRHNVTSYDAWYVALAEALNMRRSRLRDCADADYNSRRRWSA